jgi:hypothetical protein
MVPAMAAQFVARQQLTGSDFPKLAVSLANAQVRPIPLLEARRFVAQFEPATVPAQLAFGLFTDRGLSSVVMFGPDYAANLSTWRFDGQIIALLRGASASWAPRNAASKLIRGAMRLLPAEFKIVTAMTDATVGERGAIYRAAGFLPVETAKGGRRALVRFRGQYLSERSARRRFGTSSARKLAKLGLRVETVPRRLRWFAFRGSRIERRRLRRVLAGLIEPKYCSVFETLRI